MIQRQSLSSFYFFFWIVGESYQITSLDVMSPQRHKFELLDKK